MPKKYYLVIDTETVTDARFVYDIAGTLIDRKGHIMEQFNFFPQEVVNNSLFHELLFHDSFSKRKANFYNEILAYTQNIKSVTDIMAYVSELLAKYPNTVIVAYNASFDIKVLDNLASLFGGSSLFFPSSVLVYDLMHMAISAICNTKTYAEFACSYSLFTDKGNISTNAESVYSFITNNLDFKEAHTALADTEIEAAILTQVFKTHKAMKTTSASPIFKCEAWKQVQARAKK